MRTWPVVARPHPRFTFHRRHEAFAGTVEVMNSRTGRSALLAVGAIAIVVGLVWIGQGLNLIPGGFMSGDQKWFIIGLIVGLVGIVLVVLGLRRPRSGRSGS